MLADNVFGLLLEIDDTVLGFSSHSGGGEGLGETLGEMLSLAEAEGEMLALVDAEGDTLALSSATIEKIIWGFSSSQIPSKGISSP